MAWVGLSNNRTEALLNFGSSIMFFIKNILGFPLNLISTNYPFFIEHTAEMLENEVNPLILICINLTLQVLIVYWLLELIRRLKKTKTVGV